METVGDTIRWITVDNSVSKGIWNGVASAAGYTRDCAKQWGSGGRPPVGKDFHMPSPGHQPLRWLLTGSGRQAVRLAGLSGASAVALGAYGAHKLRTRTGDGASPDLVQVFETANRYHMMHSLALLGAPLCRRPALVTSLLSAGIVIFSGTCYYYALTGDKSVRKYTPYGGMLLIAGWLAMML